ncbi:MAG: flavin reductase family protein [Paracoccaceae bacterium]
MEPEIDPKDLRAAFGKFATGVTVITTQSGDTVHGMTANSFTSVSMSPPMLLICIHNSARSLAAIQSAKAFGVSVLAAHQQAVSTHFAGKPVLDHVAFCEGVGVPTIQGAVARFGCTLEQAHVAGDHTILVGRIKAYVHAEDEPLLFCAGAYREIVA